MDQKQGKKLPEELSAPFRDYLEQIDHLHRLLHLSMRGIAMIQGLPKLVEALADPSDAEEDQEQQLKQANADARLAKDEMASGFRLLHEQAVISLWGSLEVLVRNLVSVWLRKKPELLLVAPLCSVKVRVGDYAGLEEDDRYRYLCELLEQEVRAPLKPGVGRFEEVLGPLGLGGGFSDEYKKRIFELSQVRNVYAHRRGIVDRQLVEACPWLHLRPGDRLVTRHEDYYRYQEAAGVYIWELIQRVAKGLGWDPAELNRPPCRRSANAACPQSSPAGSGLQRNGS